MTGENGQSVTPPEEEATAFILEQYRHLNEHRRQVNSFSWQIPTIAFAALLFILNLSSLTIERWRNDPIAPALGFFIITFFMFVLRQSHNRHRLTRQWLDDLIAKMEERHGHRPNYYAVPDGPSELGLSWLQKRSSSKLLSRFISSVIVVTLLVDLYFWYRLIILTF